MRSAEVVLLLVPGSLREAALALGAPRWRVVTRVVLPTARPGWSPARCWRSRAAWARPRRCCSPSPARTRSTGNLNQQMNALPLQIFSDITSPRSR